MNKLRESIESCDGLPLGGDISRYLTRTPKFFKICFWLHCVFTAVHRLSLVAVSGATLYLWCVVFSLLLQSTGSRACGLQWMWCTGLVVPWHVESSWIGDQTHSLCIGSWILSHWTITKVLSILLQTAVTRVLSLLA